MDRDELSDLEQRDGFGSEHDEEHGRNDPRKTRVAFDATGTRGTPAGGGTARRFGPGRSSGTRQVHEVLLAGRVGAAVGSYPHDRAWRL